MKAIEVYIGFRVYQHWLKENNLVDDSQDITVKSLMRFIKENISEDDYKRLYQFCVEAY